MYGHTLLLITCHLVAQMCYSVIEIFSDSNDHRMLSACRHRARDELRRLADNRRYTQLRSRGHRYLHELDTTQEDQLHSAVNQAIHGQNQLWSECCTGAVLQYTCYNLDRFWFL